MATVYRPRAPLSAGAVLAVFAAAAASGLLVGAAYYQLRALADLLIVAALVAGYAVGRGAAAAVRRVRLSRPGIAAVLAASGALLVFATDAALAYRAHASARAADAAELRALRVGIGAVDPNELAAPPRPGALDFLLGYLGLDDAPPPTADGRATRFGSGAAALAAVELALASLLAAAVARAEAAHPACPRCGRWRTERRLRAAAEGTAPAIERALLAGDLDAARAALRPPDTREEVRLSALTCPAGHDGDAGVLRLCDRRLDRRGRLRTIVRCDLAVSAAELAALAEDEA